ncbi:hypothetical protein SAMN05216456_1735 [Devosia crocina]|uniref:Uncharacterized protein n=1 Tax=Devosia crocina TaxID=429728 RepID=A0A1I7NDC1_9HYPH|nr:hypothetical protein [Devosia crocina]SFV32678.1 hypothetical protein SAMN05216456_1735 [Devosia crocina]
MRLAIALLASALVQPAFATEQMAQQLDSVAPLIEAENFELLGGPDTHEGIVETVGGRWFTLSNTARNWEGDGSASDRETLTWAIERTCADDWEIIITHEATGPNSFLVQQLTPDGADKGTFEMEPVPGSERRFSMEASDQYILEIFDMTDADAMRQDAVLADMRARMEEGLDIWMPSPDLMVNVSSFEVEVWGRCPPA